MSNQEAPMTQGQELWENYLLVEGPAERLYTFLLQNAFHPASKIELATEWKLMPNWTASTNAVSIHSVILHRNKQGLLNGIEFCVTSLGRHLFRKSAFGKEAFAKSLSRAHEKLILTHLSAPNGSRVGSRVEYKGAKQVSTIHELVPTREKHLAGQGLVPRQRRYCVFRGPIVETLISKGDAAAAEEVRRYARTQQSQLREGDLWTPMHWAAMLGCEQTMRALLEAKVDPTENTETHEQKLIYSPLTLAAGRAMNTGDPELFRQLLAACDPRNFPNEYAQFIRLVTADGAPQNVKEVFFDHIEDVIGRGDAHAYMTALETLAPVYMEKALSQHRTWIAEQALVGVSATTSRPSRRM